MNSIKVQYYCITPYVIFGMKSLNLLAVLFSENNIQCDVFLLFFIFHNFKVRKIEGLLIVILTIFPMVFIRFFDSPKILPVKRLFLGVSIVKFELSANSIFKCKSSIVECLDSVNCIFGKCLLLRSCRGLKNFGL